MVSKTYYEKNKDVLLAKAKKYYEENKEELKERSRKYYKENKENIKERGTLKKYYEEHKEELQEKSRQYNKDHAEQIRLYKEKNRARILANQAAWRAKKRLERGLSPLPVVETAEQREFTRKNREKALFMLSRMKK
jgi:hypothetical protein